MVWSKDEYDKQTNSQAPVKCQSSTAEFGKQIRAEKIWQETSHLWFCIQL